MKTVRKQTPFCWIAVLGSMILIVPSGVCHGGWPYSWSYTGWGPGWFSRWSDVERLPHYALFPPVYYSHPEPRTYGYSPFASFPELKTVVEVQPAEPLLVRNSHVRSASGTEIGGEAFPDGPLVVRNPFVDRTEKTGLDKCARIATLAAPSK